MAKEMDLFQDSKTVSIEFKSTGKKVKREINAASTQTPAFKGLDSALQSVSKSDFASQTEKPSVPKISKESLSDANVVEISLFLKRVEGAMSNQLIENANSAAFDGYFVEWEEEIKDVSLSYTLSHDQHLFSSDTAISDLSWNATGSTIAASFACNDHPSWCSHKGQICAWNMAFRSFQPGTPSFTAETASCLMCIAFHPVIPSLLVGGLFTGEIIVWRLSETHDPVLAISKISDYSHHEPVSKLVWVKKEGIQDEYRITSVGSDGKILEWDLENKLIMPIKMSNVGTKSIPRLLKLQNGNAVPLGIKSIAWTKENTLEYLIGTETGFVLRCSTAKSLELGKNSTGTKSSPNPVVYSYSPHLGSCVSISFSPFHRNLFLTCSNDGTIHLYHILSFSPILTWEPIDGKPISVQWSRSRPSVFCYATSKGTVFLYDLSISKTTPMAEINPTQGAIPALALRFNPSRKEVLAVGMDECKINIWRLKSSITESTTRDQETINQFGTV